jgi:CBS domain containing-hemolysin-like protein
VAIVAVLLGSVFAAADTALTSIPSHRLNALIDQAEGTKRRTLERIRRDDARLRSSYMLGRIGCIILSTLWFSRFFGSTGIQEIFLSAALAAFLLAGSLYEVSTTLARKYADHVAPAAARYLRPFELLFSPLVLPLGWVGARLRGRDGEVAADPRVTEVEVEMMVDEVERSGIVGHEPAEMIRNVLEFADRTAKDVMISRSSIEGIELATPLDDVVALVTAGGHSRYPVYRDQIDHVVGLLYAKDLFQAIEQARHSDRPPITLKDVLRAPINFVAESQPLSSLLREMRSQRQHLAIVVDELGTVSGIVTLEDVLEVIVGDIQDEHDVDEGQIEDLGDGRLVADANVSIVDLSRYLGTDLPNGREDTSLEGLLCEHAGRVPEEGTAISKFGLRFIVRDADDKHIGKVEIVRPRSASA